MDIEREVRNVLDEPAPPPPPEPANRQGDDNRGPHIHVVFCPLLMVHPDGSIGTDGWRGTALVVAFVIAAFVVVWQALQQLGAWVASTSVYGVPLLSVVLVFCAIALAVAFSVAAVYALGAAVMLACRALYRWWRGRRTRKAVPQ